MARTGPVETGDPLVIPADEWNRHTRAADRILGHEDTTNQRESRGSGDHVYVQNEGSADLDIYEPAIITGVVFAHPEDDEDTYSNEWNESWVLKVKPPSEITDAEWKASYQWHQFVITQEPIDADEAGPAMISGITPFKITSSSGSALSAETHLRWKDNLESLEADTYGPARILYMRTGAATGWGLIQFPVTESKLWSGTLTENMGATTSGEASCTIHHNDASSNFGSVNVQAMDTSSIFATLSSGAKVLLMQNGSEFRLIQAGC